MDQRVSSDDMARAATNGRVVGDTGIKIPDIISKLSGETTLVANLRRKLTGLGRRLGVSLEDRQRLDNEKWHGKPTLDVLEDIITIWKSDKGENATIDKLVHSFKAEGMTDAAEILEMMEVTSISSEPKSNKSCNIKLSEHTRNRKNDNGKTTDGSTDSLISSGDFETRKKANSRDKNRWKSSLLQKRIKIILAISTAVVIIVPLAYIYKHLHNMASHYEKNVSGSADANSPSTFTGSGSSRPIQDSKDNANVDFTQNCETEPHKIIHVSSFKEYETKIFEAGNKCVNLTISISNPSHWPANSNMPKVKQITSLTLSGTISQKLLLSILSQATQILDLHISNDKNDFCKHIQKSWDTPVTPHKGMYTSRIKSVILSGFSVCAHFYKNFGIYLRVENLLSISFINSVFTNNNIIPIQNIIYQSENTLQNLEINGMSNITQHFYNPNKVLREVKRLKLDINTMLGSVVTQVSLVEINFCGSIPNLEVFESSTGVAYSDILLVLKCKKLKSISSTVIFGEKDGFWNMNESVKSKNLRSLTLHFIFSVDCPNHQQIKQLGLNEEINGVVKTVSTNRCSISAGTGNSEEVIFVEEYSKT